MEPEAHPQKAIFSGNTLPSLELLSNVAVILFQHGRDHNRAAHEALTLINACNELLAQEAKIGSPTPRAFAGKLHSGSSLPRIDWDLGLQIITRMTDRRDNRRAKKNFNDFLAARYEILDGPLQQITPVQIRKSQLPSRSPLDSFKFYLEITYKEEGFTQASLDLLRDEYAKWHPENTRKPQNIP